MGSHFALFKEATHWWLQQPAAKMRSPDYKKLSLSTFKSGGRESCGLRWLTPNKVRASDWHLVESTPWLRGMEMRAKRGAEHHHLSWARVHNKRVNEKVPLTQSGDKMLNWWRMFQNPNWLSSFRAEEAQALHLVLQTVTLGLFLGTFNIWPGRK